jgi:hypothetical protein
MKAIEWCITHSQHEILVGEKSSKTKTAWTYVAGATCLLDGLLNYSSTLKMEAIRSSETSGATQRTTRRHIPEDDTLQSSIWTWGSLLGAVGLITLFFMWHSLRGFSFLLSFQISYFSTEECYQCNVMVNIPVLFWWSHRYESWPGGQPSWLRCFIVFVSPTRPMLD